jgi:hypothetical protein
MGQEIGAERSSIVGVVLDLSYAYYVCTDYIILLYCTKYTRTRARLAAGNKKKEGKKKQKKK